MAKKCKEELIKNTARANVNTRRLNLGIHILVLFAGKNIKAHINHRDIVHQNALEYLRGRGIRLRAIGVIKKYGLFHPRERFLNVHFVGMNVCMLGRKTQVVASQEL